MLKRLKLGDLLKEKKAHSQTGPFGTQLKASEYVEEGFPVINVRNIGMGDVRADNLEYINEEKALELKSHSLRENDIVFGRKGAVERHSLITKKEEGWIQGSDCIRLRFLTQEFNPTFISYFFRTQTHQQWMINLGSFGATMGSLNQEIISKIEIPDIPRGLQDKIASILSAYDDLIENNNQRIKLLEEMAEEIYKEWFVRLRFPGYQETKFFDQEGKEVGHGTSGALPEGWEQRKLRDCLSHYIGGGWGEESPNGKNVIPAHVIRGTDIPDLKKGQLNFDVLRFHSESNLSSRACKPNDIIFEVSGGTENQSLGRTAFISKIVLERFKDEVIPASFCKLLRVNPKIVSPFFINSLLNRMYSTNELMVFQVQSTGISNYQFEDFIDATKIPVPAKDVQLRFENLTAPMIDEIQILGEKNQILQETRALLLPRLISGKLNVEDLEINEAENLPVAAEPLVE